MLLLGRPKSRLAFVASTLLTVLAAAEAQAYERVTDSEEVVLNKLFPKKGKVQLDGKAGIVLNSSYTETFLMNGGLNYFWSEEWGFNLEANLALSKDKPERLCIESFYNDPNFAVSSEECGDGAALAEDSEGDANFGPAYVPIRKLKYIFTANAVWNPIYGKQIILLSATNYFDFFVSMGGGIAMSDFYPQQSTLPDGRASRGKFCVNKDAKATPPRCTNQKDNPGTDDLSLIGEEGRPAAEAQSNVLVHLAIGQRFHFLKRFLISGSLENYTLLGTEAGFDNFLTIMGGLGVRF